MPGGSDDDDEQSFWREYLLYNRSAASSSWSMPRTAGAGPSRPPARRRRPASSVRYLGTLYRKLYAYNAKVTYVLGEFYWQVERDQQTFNRDFQGTARQRASA